MTVRKIKGKDDIVYRPAQLMGKFAMLLNPVAFIDGQPQYFVYDTDIGEVCITVHLTKTKTVTL